VKSKLININWDAIGISASMLCAIHCAALPIILTVSAFSSLAWLETPAIEVSFLLASFLIASYSLTRGFVKHHHIIKALLIVGAGFAFMLSSRFIGGTWHHLLTAIGGVIVAYAHWLNWQLTRNCDACEHH
jgi:hypothetical protein